MKILVTGSTGLVGSVLVPSLRSKGHEVLRAVRSSPKGADEIQWDPERGTIDVAKLVNLDAAVHLAGESVADGRWSDEKKRRILDSRVKGTRLLSETLARLNPKPGVLVSASAIGYYGSRGSEVMTEESTTGEGFLASVSRQWESSTSAAAEAGIRVVSLRIGIVLSVKGGALGKMLPPFKLGLGGKVGDGKQFMSWIAVEDVVGIIEHALEDKSLSGPVNTVAPSPVTNAEFTKALGQAISRPTIFPLPAFAARLAFGEMADETLLSSTRVLPERLTKSGYKFQFSQLDVALRNALKK
jgi:uncharacterized protein (TIGR01777 family)